MAGKYDFDVVVIGGGIGGFVSAVTANSLGKRVAIVEKRKVGGNCTNFTCIPSKALIRTSHVNREATHLDDMGLSALSMSGVDTKNVMTRIRSVVQKAYEKDLPETFREIGIDVLSGAASFSDPTIFSSTGEASPRRSLSLLSVPVLSFLLLRAYGNWTISQMRTSTKWKPSQNPFLYSVAEWMVSNTLLPSEGWGLRPLSWRWLPHFLPMADRELVTTSSRFCRLTGYTFSPEQRQKASPKMMVVVLTFLKHNGEYGETRGERVLVSIGRKPDLEGLSLENAGVKYNSRGIITDKKLMTSTPNIYACGDIVGPYQLASTAEYQGMIAGANVVLPLKRRVDYGNNVYVVFTEPQIGYLGLSEEEAHRKYSHKLKVYRFYYKNMRRAMVDGTERGIAKFLCDGKGRLVGAHILGEGGAEVIHEAQVIKALKKPLHKLYSLTHAYPTYSQALLGRASQLAYLERMGDNFFANKALALFPGLENRLHLARIRLAETEPPPPASNPIEPMAAIHVDTYKEDSVLIIRFPEDLTNYDEEPIFSAISSKNFRITFLWSLTSATWRK